MKKIILTLLLVSFFISSFTSSQVTQEWVKIFQGNNGSSAEARDFEKDIFGNLFIAGYTTGVNNSDILLLKYDSNGQLLFNRLYDSTYEGGRALTTDLNGNIYIAGDGSFIGITTIILKYDNTGNFQWRSTIAVNYSSYMPIDIKWDRNNIYVGGNISDNEGYDVFIAKYNSEGTQKWIKRFNSQFDSNDVMNQLLIDNSGDIYVCGNSLLNSFNTDYLLVKYDSNGNLIWSKNFDDGNSENQLTGSYADIANNIYLTGTSQGNYFTIKVNPQGNELWRRFYSGIEPGNQPEAITGDENNNIYITGQSKDSTIVNFNIATIKYDESGNLNWAARYSGPGLNYDVPSSITLDNNNDIYISGFITNLNGNRDFATLKYNSNGVLSWNQYYNSNGFDESIGVICDTLLNVYVCGNSSVSGSNSIRIIKYSQTIGIHPVSSEIPINFSLSQNYPNPFNPATKIQFAIPLSRGVDAEGGRGVLLKVFDLLGREIATLVNEKLNPGTYEVDWDASNYPSGVYFYTLSAGEFKETRKMVLIK